MLFPKRPRKRPTNCRYPEGKQFGVFRDTDDILPTEEWKGRLEELIAEADTIVFLLSPHSATSEICGWEVEYATSLNKRIAPIVIDDVDTADIPPLLARLNFIFCTPRDPFENAVATLVSALGTDIEWIREHTRLAGLARRWQAASHPTRLKLRGQDIVDSELWRDTRPSDAPAVTALQAKFITDSRQAAAHRQRYWVFGSLGVATATLALAAFAYMQSVEADHQRAEAEEQRSVAIANATEASQQRDLAEHQQQLATEQRDLAEARLREALIERTRRNLSDAEAMLDDGRFGAAADETVTAINTALDLDDRTLITHGEAVGRRLLFEDQLHSYLEGEFDPSKALISIVVSPDGRSALGLTKQTLTIWNISSGRSIRTIKDVEAAGYRDDGMIVGMRNLSAAQSLQSGAGAQVFTVDPLSAVPTALTQISASAKNAWIFPAADLLLVQSQREKLQIISAFDLKRGAPLFERVTQFASIDFVAASNAWNGIILAGDNEIEVLNRQGTVRETFDAGGRVEALKLAPMSDVFALKTPAGYFLRDMEVGETRPIMAGNAQANDIHFLGIRQLVAQSGINRAQLLNLDTLQPITTLQTFSAFGLAGMGFENKTVIVRGAQHFTTFDAKTGDKGHEIGRPTPPLGGWNLSNDGRFLATVMKDGLVSVWSTETGQEALTIMPSGGGQWIQILDRPSGSVVAIIDITGRLGLWRIEDSDLAFNDTLFH
ncbi:MAG: TIR domain-containing protein, partial [Alphaproteobacteria bacterium]